MEKEFYVIAFESTHHAIMVEKKLKKNYKIDTIPTPREITASCGLSIKFSSDKLDNILNELKIQDIKREGMGIYKVIREENNKIAEKINWG